MCAISAELLPLPGLDYFFNFTRAHIFTVVHGCFILTLSTFNDMHCSCIGYLVILCENYKLLCVKSRIEIKVKGSK